MVVPYANAPAHCSVLIGQVFRGDLRDLRGRYFFQLLNKPSHRLEGRDHFEDSDYETLSSNPI
jgi:hypothetical protein